ncbi:MAG: hypothetical protein LBK00_07105 [Treponema sp.]|jgi:hypothetical protein|nr:hypothetical protein [Treponema sp.]
MPELSISAAPKSLSLAVVGLFNSRYRERFMYKSWFLRVAFLLLNQYNLITVKLNLIPIQWRAGRFTAI